jgi:large exoprotein involved in heme utilization and adhesion
MPTLSKIVGLQARCKLSLHCLALAILLVPVCALAAGVAVDALPTGGQVVAGSATIASTPANMSINQSSQRAVVNWQSFDVGANAQVNFNQPNAQAVTLNRVTGATA